MRNRKTTILVWGVTLIFLALFLNGIFLGSVAIPLKQALSVFLGREGESAAARKVSTWISGATT